MLRKSLLLLLALPLMMAAQSSRWIESDSLKAINERIARDFPITVEEGKQQILKLYPSLTPAQVDDYITKGYIETLEINGKNMMYRKSPRNLPLIAKDMREADGWFYRGSQAPYVRRSMAKYTIDSSKGEGEPVVPQRVTINFKVTVPYDPALEGDTLRVWMPYPLETARQSNVTLDYVSQPDYILSTPDRSVHSTIYMEAPAKKDGNTFEITVNYDVAAQYFSPEFILSNLKPYDKSSQVYQKYTAFDGPHYKYLPIAKEIVGNETNPFRQSEMVYDWIIERYPWAGAREYSTLDCIPQYVLDHGYGDCGQVSLLYISLMRSLGVPARWESGWMLHPGEKNYHDWAEVYFEGVGWVPVDTSFGRYRHDSDQRVHNFHSTGQDNYRFASNNGIGGQLYPEKKFVRSETVDFQAGEVETSKGNLFYPLWDSQFTIVSMKPLK